MRSGNRATNHVRELLRLPEEAHPDDVFACVFGCLTDVLDYEFITPFRLPGKGTRYQAAWLSRDGRRYEGKGSSDREAALAAAALLISQSEDAALLRQYAEPELDAFEVTAGGRLRVKPTTSQAKHNLRRVRRAGSAE